MNIISGVIKILLLLWNIILYPRNTFEKIRNRNFVNYALILILLTLGLNLLRFVNVYSIRSIIVSLFSSFCSILVFILLLNYFVKKSGLDYGFRKLLTYMGFSLTPALFISIINLLLPLYKVEFINHLIRIATIVWTTFLFIIGIQVAISSTRIIAIKLYLKAFIFTFCVFLLLGIVLSIFNIFPKLCFPAKVVSKEKILKIGGGKDVSIADIKSVDILVLENGEEVKLIGLDSSIDDEFHERVLEYMKPWILGQKVKLKLDHFNEDTNHLDKYGRLLVYIYLEIISPQPPEVFESFVGEYLKEKRIFGVTQYCYEVFFNAQMIYDGYAKADRNSTFEHKDQFINLEEDARNHKRGLWKGI